MQKLLSLPLYARMLLAIALGISSGLILGPYAKFLEVPAQLLLRLLGALAPALILVAIVQALVNTEIQASHAKKLLALLLLNTTVAITIGLSVANILKPGVHAAGFYDPVLHPPESVAPNASVAPSLAKQFFENVPKSILGPLVDNNVIGIIILAVAFGIALKGKKDRVIPSVKELIDLTMDTLTTVLHYLLAVVPLGVFGIIASTVGVKGLTPLLSLLYFIIAVLVGLLLQVAWYLVRIKTASRFSPLAVVTGCRDAFVTAFSTSSSVATMPITYDRLVHTVGVSPRAASLGALVGGNLNNDGTGLYEAMAALFIAQLIGQDLTLSQQLLTVLTSIVASVGAAGIPEAGLVTMTLVFSAVGLPLQYIALLLSVDWFLDRCRTVTNVMGDVNVSCLIDEPEKSSRIK